MNRRVIVHENKTYEYFGTCLGFSVDYEELNNGIGQFPVAIVEKDCNGRIELPYVKDIRFIDKYKQKS